MSSLAASLTRRVVFLVGWILGQECLSLAHVLRAELAISLKLLFGLVGLLLTLRRHVVVVRHLVLEGVFLGGTGYIALFSIQFYDQSIKIPLFNTRLVGVISTQVSCSSTFESGKSSLRSSTDA